MALKFRSAFAVFILTFIFCFVFSSPVSAVKFGINVAQHDGITTAAQLVGNGGWVVAMMGPGDVGDAIRDANAYNVNLVIRSRHSAPGGPELTSAYAREWVQSFTQHYTSIKNSVYFVPINEPNNPFEGINCSNPVVKEYLDALLNGFKNGAFGGVVKLSTPSFDPFQTADNGNGCFDALGGANYFSQYDAVSYHAYGQMSTAGMDTSASPIKLGSVQAFLTKLGLPTSMAVIIDETGVGCLDCPKPDAGGGSWVKYPFTQQYADMFSTYLHSQYVQSEWTQDNVKMFAMLSYSPETPVPDEGSWIDKPLAASVVTMAEAAVGGGTGPGPGVSIGPTRKPNPTPTGLPGPVERYIRNSVNNVPAAQKKYVDGVQSTECFFLDFQCKDMQAKIQDAGSKPKKSQAQAVQEPPPPSNIFESIGDFFGNLFNLSSTPKGYANTFFSDTKTTGNQTGLGGVTAEQTETVKTHKEIFEAMLPYRSSNLFGDTNVDYSPDPTGNGGTPYPTVDPNVTLGPAPTQVAEYARYLFTSAGTLCNPIVGASFDGIRTVSLTAALIPRCLQGKIASPVYTTLYQSADAHTYLQCVGYVMGVEQGTGGGLDGRNAKMYCTGAVPARYRRLSRGQISASVVRAGDIGVYDSGVFGHIFTIGEVFPNGLIRIYEANWAVSGSIGVRQDTLTNPKLGCVLQRTF